MRSNADLLSLQEASTAVPRTSSTLCSEGLGEKTKHPVLESASPTKLKNTAETNCCHFNDILQLPS